MNRRHVRVLSPAKVNLCLGVGPVRSDGYHRLATVYQAVGLYDELDMTCADRATGSLTVRGSVDLAGVPSGPENLAVRAVDLLAEHHGRQLPVSVLLTKDIPVAGGLAGGSTDAAAALLAADLLFDLETPRAELLALAARLGSDVPFCLLGGTAIGSGRGELVRPLPTTGEFWWVVVPDPDGLSTPAVYTEFDRLHADRGVPDPVVPEELVRALATGDAPLLGASLRNDLEPATFSFRPDLRDLLDAGRAGRDGVPGALGAAVSGSGPTTVFLTADEHHARRLARHLHDVRGPRARTAPFVVRSPARGARAKDAMLHKRGTGAP